MSSNSIVMIEMLLILFRLFSIALLSPKVFSLFLIKLRGCSYDRLPLPMFSPAKTVLTSLFSDSILLAGEAKTVVLKEAILG